MANEDYNNVELTEEEEAGLNDVILNDETTESQETEKSDAVQTAEETTTEEPSGEEVNETEVEDSFDGLEIDGKQFNREEILAWRDDSDNKSSWSKSNTEKAQQLSKWHKLADKIQSDDSFKDHLKDYFFDNPEAVKALGLDGDVSLPEVEESINPEMPSVLEERLNVLEGAENERILNHNTNILSDELDNLTNQYPEYLDGVESEQSFLEFAEANASRFSDGGVPNLQNAFKEWSFDKMNEKLSHYKKLEDNSARNRGKIINTAQVGAKEVKTDKKLGWNDVNMENPDIAKYFENE